MDNRLYVHFLARDPGQEFEGGIRVLAARGNAKDMFVEHGAAGITCVDHWGQHKTDFKVGEGGRVDLNAEGPDIGGQDLLSAKEFRRIDRTGGR